MLCMEKMRVSRVLGQIQSLPVCSSYKCTLLASTASRAAQMGNSELLVWTGQWRAGGWSSVSTFQVKKVGSGCEMAQESGPWRQLRQLSCQQEISLLQKLKANFAFYSENVWEVVAKWEARCQMSSKSSHFLGFSHGDDWCVCSLMWKGCSEIHHWSSSICEDAQRL